MTNSITVQEEIKKKLNAYSKDELIHVIALSDVASSYVILKCKSLYGVKTDPNKKKPAAKKEV